MDNSIQVYDGLPATLEMFDGFFEQDGDLWRAITSGLSKKVLGAETIEKIEKMRLSRNIPANILVVKRSGEERARELLHLPNTGVKYLGYPFHIGTLRDQAYFISLGDSDVKAVVIKNPKLVSCFNEIFDNRYSRSQKY
ncbi:MAG: hypothetical protein Q8N63_01405 [Nanoarchaeota archaeon]|nr:hypothetical protein [Nanoarchaeota archaeon]